MKKYLVLVFTCMVSYEAHAEKWRLPIFRTEDGHTNWQHLANYTGGTLLILLTIVSIYLYLTRRRLRKTNQELNAIKRELENRVQERTENLSQSNLMLKESNLQLEKEIADHVITSRQLRVSESYIKDILKSMPLMLVGLDKEGYVTQWNRRVEDVSGIKSEDALGKTLWEVYPKTIVMPEHIQQAIEENKAIHLKRSMRSVYHYEITIYPLHEKDAGVVILVDDVSEQTAAKNMLIHNDKMSFMSELASTMAHDINMPLQSILLDLEHFQRMISGHGDHDSSELTDSDKLRQLGTIVTDMSARAKQVSSIISNLLAFARSRSGNKQSADIVDVMENTILLANEVLSFDGDISFEEIEIERHFEKNLPMVPCYITELRQVFLSLFRHACFAMRLKQKTGDFKPLIKIVLAENYENLWIKIHHNGLGLTAEEQMNLFEPLFTNKSSAENFDAAQHLSFSYYIITEQHEGNMAVTSDIDVGTTFHIQLPVRE